MTKKLLLTAGLAMALAFSLIAGRLIVRANPAPGIQDFDLDMANCLLASYAGTPPIDLVSPDPMTGFSQDCKLDPGDAKGTDVLMAPYPTPTPAPPADASVSMSTSIGLIAGNRLGYPYVYNGPGWQVQGDGDIADDTVVGDVASNIDLYQDGNVDWVGDDLNCAPGGVPGDCSTALSFSTVIPEAYVKETLTWNTTSGCDGEDESFLTDVLPGASAMTPLVRYRACIDTVFLLGKYRVDIKKLNGADTPLNLVTLSPNWSPAGSHVDLVQLAGEGVSPTTGLLTLDSPQASLSHTNRPYAANPTTPGLYVRWITEISSEDEANRAVNFVYSTSCKTIGGVAIDDDDADCLADAPVDPGWTVAPVGGTQGPFTFTYPLSRKVNANSLATEFSITLAGNLTAVDVTAEPAGCNAGDRHVGISGGKLYLWYTGASKSCIAPGNTITLKVNTSTGVATQDGYIWDVLDANAANPDQDNDGLLDGVEVAWGSDPTDTDTDDDGRTDAEEMVGPTQLLTAPVDYDGAGLFDATDTDGDGVDDGGLKLDLKSGLYDGANGCQDDAGPDGKPDCPDADGDGISTGDTGISANQDLSGDGSSHRRLGFKIVGEDILANGAGKDNCPSAPNADQKNTDYDTSLGFNANATLLGNGDLYGDECDSDADQDSFVDVAEAKFQYDQGAHQCSNDKDLPGPATPLNSPNLDPDSDDDGVLDGRECETGSNPSDAGDSPGTPGAANDPDKDGVSNAYETARRSQGFSNQPSTITITRNLAGADASDVALTFNVGVPAATTITNVAAGGNTSGCPMLSGVPNTAGTIWTVTWPAACVANTETIDVAISFNGAAPTITKVTWSPAIGDDAGVGTAIVRVAGNEDVDTDQDGSGGVCDLAGNCGGGSVGPPAIAGDWDSDSDGLSDGCEAYVTGTSPLSQDTDWDGTLDPAETGAHDRAIAFCDCVDNAGQAVCDQTAAQDLDSDGVNNDVDNCLFVANGAAEDNQANTQPLIANGKGIAGDDKSVPWNPYRWSSPPAPAWDIDLRGDACDGDLDNDSVPDSAPDTDGAVPPLDITYDDNVSGTVCAPLDPGGDGAPEDGASWDTDCDTRLEGVDALCSAVPIFPDMPAGWATLDSDKDGLLNKWEFCKWASSPLYGRVDSDGDGRGDCVEAADVQGDGALNFTGDVIYYAKAILLGKATFGQDGQFDINADGALNFTGDVIQEAKFGLLTGLCK